MPNVLCSIGWLIKNNNTGLYFVSYGLGLVPFFASKNRALVWSDMFLMDCVYRALKRDGLDVILVRKDMEE